MTDDDNRFEQDMKQLILKKIYSLFASWSSPITFACSKGCAACCTQDVIMTAIEGELIYDFIARHNKELWLAEKLQQGLPEHLPACTTNEYAGACLRGEEIDPGGGRYDRICPFLEQEACAIYQVRPFNCRVFASTKTCRKGVSATLSEYYLSAATAVSQIIEHLDQGLPWGNMLILLARKNSGDTGKQEMQDRWRTARPLPGFLIDGSDYPQVAPLLEQIFTAEIGGRKVEDILNGR